MGLPLNKRDYDIFLSYAHAEKPFVQQLYAWLQDIAGFQVWWDCQDLSAGARLAIDLQKGIGRCRAIVLVASQESLSRGWVKNEYSAAMDEWANFEGFRMVMLRMANADMEQLMKGISWIDVPNATLTPDIAVEIIRALYPSDNQPNPVTSRDVYVSASWRADDHKSAKAVCRYLAGQGLRLIGDSRDQQGFGTGNRIEQIMASCGAFVAVLPFRGEAKAMPGEGPYKYFLQEIDLAQRLGLPSVVIADPRVSCPEAQAGQWLSMETDAEQPAESVQIPLQSLWEKWRAPGRPHYVFCAMDLDSQDTRVTGQVRQLIQCITSMPTKVGDEVHQGNSENVNAAVRQAVCQAFLVLADLTDNNLNTCIEAGMALAAQINLELIAFGEQRRPPFMLRERNMPTYTDRLQQIGLIHKLMRPYRRRVINAEL